jgi:hypothetical protein
MGTETGELRTDVDDKAKAKVDPRANLSKAVDEILADPEAFRKECDERARAENPHLTQEQLDASWAQVAEQFGL